MQFYLVTTGVALFYHLISSVVSVWPDCGNFAEAKGYPAGCIPSLNAFCVNQDDDCKSLMCKEDTKALFRVCNDVCSGEGNSMPGVECYCLSNSPLMCPANEMSVFNMELQPSTSVDDFLITNYKFVAGKDNFWGAKIKKTGLSQILVYCTGEKLTCEMKESLCEQKSCYPGQCFYNDHCYYTKPHSTSNVCGNEKAKPVGVETIEEREFLFFLINETYPGDNLERVGTSGVIESGSIVGEWKDWGTEIDPVVVEVMNDINEPDNSDQQLVITRDECGEVVWEFLLGDGNSPIIMCEVDQSDLPSTTTDVCDTITPDYSTISTVTFDDTSQSDSSSGYETIPDVLTSTPISTDFEVTTSKNEDNSTPTEVNNTNSSTLDNLTTTILELTSTNTETDYTSTSDINDDSTHEYMTTEMTLSTSINLDLTTYTLTDISETTYVSVTSSNEFSNTDSTESPDVTSTGTTYVSDTSSSDNTESPDVTSTETTYVSEMSSSEPSSTDSSMSPDVTSIETTYVSDMSSSDNTESPDVTSTETTYVSDTSSSDNTESPDVTSTETTYVSDTSSSEPSNTDSTESPDVTSSETTYVSDTSSSEPSSTDSSVSPDITSTETTYVSDTSSNELSSTDGTESPDVTSTETTYVSDTSSSEPSSTDSTESPDVTSTETTYVSDTSSNELSSTDSTESPDVTSTETTYVSDTSSNELSSTDSSVSPDVTSTETTYVSDTSSNELSSTDSSVSPDVTSTETTYVSDTSSSELSSTDSSVSPDITNTETTYVSDTSSSELSSTDSTESPDVTSTETTYVSDTSSNELSSTDGTATETISYTTSTDFISSTIFDISSTFLNTDISDSSITPESTTNMSETDSTFISEPNTPSTNTDISYTSTDSSESTENSSSITVSSIYHTESTNAIDTTESDTPSTTVSSELTSLNTAVSFDLTTSSALILNTTLLYTTTEFTNSTDDPSTTEETTSEEQTTPSSTDDPNSCKETCTKEDQYEEEWVCCTNSTCMKKCPLEAKGHAVWHCTINSTYLTSVPDYSGCHNPWVYELSNRVEHDNITSWELLQSVDLYATEDSLFGHEMNDVIDFSNTSMTLLIEEQNSQTHPSLSKQLDERRYMTESALRVVDRMLKYDKQWEQLKEYEQVQLGMLIQNLTDFLGFSVTQVAKAIGTPFFMVSDWTDSHMESQFIIYSSDENSSPVVQFPMQPSSNSKGSSIMLSSQWIKDKNNDVIIESVGNSWPLIITEMIFPARYNSMDDSKKQLNSEMIALSLLDSKRIPMTSFPENSILVTLVHEYVSMGPADAEVHRDLYPDEKPTAVRGTQLCVFWNSSLSYNGQWDSRGCTLISHTDHKTICACNHLSSFALLMDVHDYVGKNPAMKILSIVCSVASIICLLLTLFILQFLKGVQGERSSIGKHVCLCLVIGHIICLLLLDQALLHLPDGLCIAVGVILHYVFLAAFMWMAVEGHHLYRLVIRVFDSGKDFNIIYLIVAYGTPAIIVGVTGIIALTSSDKVYGSDGLCWLASEKYIWAFMGPVFFLTTLNLIVLVLVLRVAVQAGTHQKKSVVDRARIWIRGWFSLSALLGITWLFGFVYMEWYYNLAYVFIVLTGLQGVFIFLSRVVFNDQVKSAFKRSAKKRAMLNRFYKLAWQNRSEGSSMQQSSWFLAGSASSQLDLASSSSYWDHTPSRRRSSATHPDAFTDSEKLNGSLMQSVANPGLQTSHTDKTISNSSNAWNVFRRRHSKEEDENLTELCYSSAQSNEVQQAWSNRVDLDVLSEIPEEEEEQVNNLGNKY